MHCGASAMDNTLAWCFLPRDSRWRRRDQWGHRLLVTPGKTFHATDMYEMRRRHLDALHHAPGLLVCRIRLSGDIEREGGPRYHIVHRGGWHPNWPWIFEGVGRKERLYANEFHAVWTGDATLVIHRFACDVTEQSLQAESAVGREPDERAWVMVETRRDWLAGLLSGEELLAAWKAFDAAWREHYTRCPPMPSGRLMTASESYEQAVWSAHAFALDKARYATEPVPLAAGRSVQNVKVAISVTVNPIRGETQESRIARRASAVEAINADLGRRLLEAFAPQVLSDPS